MSKWENHSERDAGAARLLQARLAAKLGSYRKLSKLFGWNENTYKAHEQGRSNFSKVDAREYAKAFNVSYQWLYLGIGSPDDPEPEETPTVSAVPLLTWVSAGQLAEDAVVEQWHDLKTIAAIDLPQGDWIALRVEGDSMNKISPPDSIILVNRRDRQLVHNGCYVITDEQGGATYKRYRANEEPPFQPASYHDVPPPHLVGAIKVIGRVRRSIIDM